MPKKIREKFCTKPVSVKNLALTTDFVKAAGTKGLNTITIGANTAAGKGDPDTAANAGIIDTCLTELFEQSRLNQTRVLDVNTDKGDIFNSTGIKVASMNGVSVSMTSTSFLDKEFTDFKVELAGHDVKFTAFLEGPGGKQEFTNTITAANIPTLVEGYKLDLTDTLSKDVLSINLGEAGLSSVSDVKNHDVIQNAFREALGIFREVLGISCEANIKGIPYNIGSEVFEDSVYDSGLPEKYSDLEELKSDEEVGMMGDIDEENDYNIGSDLE